MHTLRGCCWNTCCFLSGKYSFLLVNNCTFVGGVCAKTHFLCMPIEQLRLENVWAIQLLTCPYWCMALILTPLHKEFLDHRCKHHLWMLRNTLLHFKGFLLSHKLLKLALRIRSSGLIYERDFIVILSQKEMQQPVKAKISQPFILNLGKFNCRWHANWLIFPKAQHRL